MKAVLRLIACLVVAGAALELFFVARIAAMAVVDPQSTAFQRSEAFQIAIHQGSGGGWRQQWVPYSQINDTLKRAVIASEDAGFVDHNGVEWEAIERALWTAVRQLEERAQTLGSDIRVRREKVVRQHLPVRKCQQRQPLAREELQLGGQPLELAGIVGDDDIQPLIRPGRFGKSQRGSAAIELVPAQASLLSCRDLGLEK